MWLRHWQRRLGGVTLTTIKSPVPWKMFTAAGSGQGSCIPALAGRIGTGVVTWAGIISKTDR